MKADDAMQRCGRTREARVADGEEYGDRHERDARILQEAVAAISGTGIKVITMSLNKLESRTVRKNAGNDLEKFDTAASMSARHRSCSWDRSQTIMIDSLPAIARAPAAADTTGRCDRIQAESGFYDGA